MRRFTIYLYCLAFVLALLVSYGHQVRAEEIAIAAMSGSGEVAFISIEDEAVIGTVELNVPHPFLVETTPDGKTVVVVCGSGHICFIDVATMECVKILELLWGPEQHGITLQPNEFQGMCITPAGLALITEANEKGQLFVIDTAAMELAADPCYISGEPTRIVSKADGSQVYYLDEGSIYYANPSFSPLSYGILCHQPAGHDEIGGLDLIPGRESRAIISDYDNRIYLVSLSAGFVLDQKQVDPERFTEPVDVKVSPTGTTAIVANGTDPSVTFVLIHGDTLTIDETVEVGGPSNSVAFTQDGQTAVVTVPRTSQVKIIDVASRQVRATISEGLGLAPMGVAITTIELEPTQNDASGTDVN